MVIMVLCGLLKFFCGKLFVFKLFWLFIIMSLNLVVFSLSSIGIMFGLKISFFKLFNCLFIGGFFMSVLLWLINKMVC